jgi:hypothetical protein
MKAEDLFGKILNHKDETEAKDYLWMLHLACEGAGVDLEIADGKNEMLLIVGGDVYGTVIAFNKGCLCKEDILNIFSDVMRYMFTYSDADFNKK